MGSKAGYKSSYYQAYRQLTRLTLWFRTDGTGKSLVSPPLVLFSKPQSFPSQFGPEITDQCLDMDEYGVLAQAGWGLGESIVSCAPRLSIPQAELIRRYGSVFLPHPGRYPCVSLEKHLNSSLR